MIELSPAQISDLIDLAAVCSQLQTEIVIIGAVAYGAFIDDVDRHTGDVDVAVALDLDDFAKMQTLLKERGWKQREHREHRWFGAHGGIVDIMPAGPGIRLQQHVIWPDSQMRMSVVGFDHVFSKAEELEVRPGLRMKVIPVPVLTLLKIVSYLDRPAERERDIRDIGELLKRYEAEADERRFSDEIIERQVAYDSAGAFLLGMDLGSICSATEQTVVEAFVNQLGDETSRAYAFLKRSRMGLFAEEEDAREKELKSQIVSFLQGFRHGLAQR